MSKLLVIIPTYNEIENISQIIEAVRTLPVPADVLVVDDNSPDGTAQRVEELQLLHPDGVHLLRREGKLGLGTAYIAGFRWGLEAGYDFMCELDADFSHNPQDIPRLLTACEEGADVAIGSRYVRGINVVNWPLKRIIMSYAASLYVRLVTGMPVHDSTAGFVCYRANALREILQAPIQMKGYGFQIEMKYRAHRLGFRLREVPIVFTDRARGTSKMSGGIFSEALVGVVRLRFSKIRKP